MVLAIDRAAYILAFLLGAVGWAYISSRRVSPWFHAGCRAQLKRSLLLAIAAACPMLVSVIADAVVTALRLLEERPPVSVFLVPRGLPRPAQAQLAAGHCGGMSDGAASAVAAIDWPR